MQRIKEEQEDGDGNGRKKRRKGRREEDKKERRKRNKARIEKGNRMEWIDGRNGRKGKEAMKMGME